MRNEFDLIIFDWDGTLMDSVGHIVASMQAGIQDCHLPALPDDAVRHIIGLGLPEAIACLYPQQSPECRQQLRERYVHHFLASSHQQQMFVGAEDLLRRLKPHCSLAIATGKSRLGLKRVLGDTGLGHYFTASRCADETASKPDPRMLHELLSVTGVAACRAVMIGDTTYDLEMARAAGMASIAVTHGVHDRLALQSCLPRACVDDLHALQSLLFS